MNDIHDQNSFEQWQEQEHGEAQTNAYRECAVAMMRVLHLAVEWSSESKVKAWGVKFAIGHAHCMGMRMADVATLIPSKTKDRVTRATISNAATEFCKLAKIPPSQYMKSELSQESSRQARLVLIQRHNERKELTNSK